MIIAGYPGIGKSSVAADDPYIVDLESSSFWIEDSNHTKTRHPDWYINYCQVAEDLSRQGYTVFVSSHGDVINWLGTKGTEDFYVIVPDTSLNDAWLKRLKRRFVMSHLEKDERAMKRCELHFTSDVNELLEKVENFQNCTVYTIKSIEDYDLKEVIKKFKNYYE